MKKGGGGKKGRAWERSISRRLSLWWSNNEDDSIFWRTSGSGARASVRSKTGQKTANSHGDIMALDPKGVPLLQLITFELKCGYSKNTIADLLDGIGTQEYEKWIVKAERDAERAKSYGWMIIHKRNKRLPVVIFPTDLMDILGLGGDVALKLNWGSDKLALMTLDAFLDTVTPLTVMNALKESQCSNDSE